MGNQPQIDGILSKTRPNKLPESRDPLMAARTSFPYSREGTPKSDWTQKAKVLVAVQIEAAVARPCESMGMRIQPTLDVMEP